MIKLSLIIPYYDTYDYTIKLLRELQIQKTDEVEVIVIDDGCNEKMLDFFNGQFKIIHQEHKGASAAWNEGIRQAAGKYIAFIDSDDMIMMNYVELLIKAIDQDLADEIMFDWVDFDEDKVISYPIARAIWKAIYKREIVPFFDETCVHHTDIPFQKQLRLTPHTIVRLHAPLYIYRSKREGSISDRQRQGLLKNPSEE